MRPDVGGPGQRPPRAVAAGDEQWVPPHVGGQSRDYLDVRPVLHEHLVDPEERRPLAVEARLTGAFHEDAVADFCDAFGGGWTREEVLRILKDSRIGSYGALGLLFAIALRAGGLIAMADPWKAAMALVISGAMGRLVILAVMALVPPVPARDGLAKDVGQVADWKAFGLGVFWSAPTLFLAVLHDWIGIVLAVLLIAGFLVWYRAYLIRRIGGVTGDCLGFAAYVGFILTILSLTREA